MAPALQMYPGIMQTTPATPLTQTAVVRVARQYGVRLVSRDGPDPEAGGLGDEDISQGELSLVMGKPASSVHELAHAILGPEPREEEEEGDEDGGRSGARPERHDEFLLVMPLQHALQWHLGAGPRPSADEIQQLVAAQLWRAGALVTRQADEEDWAAATAVADRRAMAVRGPSLRHQAESSGIRGYAWCEGAGLPSWW